MQINMFALEVGPHKNVIELTYIFDDRDISIYGPFQTGKNKIRLQSSDETSCYHLKYCANKEMNKNCTKQLYIIVEELIFKKWPYLLSRISFTVLFILSVIPLIAALFSEESFISLSLGTFIIPIPIITIISIIALSNKVNKIMCRLSLITIVSKAKYSDKHIGNKMHIYISE